MLVATIMETKRYNILVVGDIMLDHYIFGEAVKISPDAPCPVFITGKEEYRLGGASNVANQLACCGCNVYLAGVIGNDTEGSALLELAERQSINCNLLSSHDGGSTTIKTRYIANNRYQLLRVDKDCSVKCGQDEFLKIEKFIRSTASEVSAVVLSDYDKGVLSSDAIKNLIHWSNSACIPSIVDIKKSDYRSYQNATIVKGNLNEFCRIFIPDYCSLTVEQRIEQIQDRLKDIRRSFNCKLLIITCGKYGLIGISDTDELYKVPAIQSAVSDVTGAGDVVTAYAIYLYINGYGFKDILSLINVAAGLSISDVGTTIVPVEAVLGRKSKVVSVNDLCRNQYLGKTVFTNGCFDLIHAGHIDTLRAAKQLGDTLIVGLNSDSSIKRIKGESRPFNDLYKRIQVLSELSCVDFIVVFDDDTPINVIESIRPSVLVKGGDYKIDEIIGNEFVKSYGGDVVVVPIRQDVSSSKLLKLMSYEA